MTGPKILSWNCNGISNKIQELSNFTKKQNIQIILFEETRLSPNTPFNISNFYIYRTDSSLIPTHLQNGGTAILICRRITHHQVTIPTSLDFTLINIKLGNNTMQISAVYKSSGTDLKICDLNTLTYHGNMFIIAGDLNAKYNT